MGSNLEEEADLISNLDDDTLCDIISLLPFKCAVRTSVFSKRWRPLWNKALALDRTIGDIQKVVTAFLDSFNQRDQLSNHPRLQYKCSQGGSLKVTIEDNKELHLDFDTEQDSQELFDWRLHCQSLRDEPTPLHCFSVRILQVKSVSKLTKDPVSSLVSNFQLLESLEIAECEGLKSFSIFGGFGSLTILDCPKLNDILIVACDLQTFRFQGLLPQFSFFYGMTSKLKDAMLDFRGGPANDFFYRENFCQFLHAISKVEVLTLCGWPFQVSIPVWLGRAGFHQDPEDFMFCRLKELRWIDSSMEENRVAILISFLELCPLLKRLRVTIDPASYADPNKEECGLTEKNLNQAGDRRPLDRLRIVKLEGFVDQKDGELFARCLIEKGVVSVFPRIIVTPHNSGLTTNCERTHQPKCSQMFDGGERASSSSSGYKKDAAPENTEMYGFENDEADDEEK